MPSKKMCGERLGLNFERSLLKALPQDIPVSTNFLNLKAFDCVSKSIETIFVSEIGIEN